MAREQRELIAVLLEVQKRRERLDAALARAEAVARDIAVERADQDDELDFIDDQSRRLARHEGRSVEEENWPEGT